ncbi:hypothetical protein NHQ30_007125 [Ciborinia camelliae]|nr:hypothetical protein NHQ30_007125 [Ciborinia camelliae]
MAALIEFMTGSKGEGRGRKDEKIQGKDGEKEKQANVYPDATPINDIGEVQAKHEQS